MMLKLNIYLGQYLNLSDIYLYIILMNMLWFNSYSIKIEFLEQLFNIIKVTFSADGIFKMWGKDKKII